jgi:hypothetical protein
MKRNLSEEQKLLHLYEIVLYIIDQNGPAAIPSICEQINNQPNFMQNRKKFVQPAQIKSVISKKKDLFIVQNDVVSIRPEKNMVSLCIEIGKCFSPWYKIRVDFVRNNFIFFEMNLDTSNRLANDPIEAGNIDDFKQALFRMKIWNWEENYEPDGIVLDGTSWSVVLKTKGQTYRSNGLDLFPKEWTKFCRSLSKLTGKMVL